MENCKKCGGRGYLLAENGMVVVCDCQNEEIYQKLYRFVGIDTEALKVEVDNENFNIQTMKGKQLSFSDTINYVLWHWRNEKNFNLYVQGPTGTGKTLFVNKLLQKVVKIVEKDGLKIKNTAYLIEFNELLSKYKNGWEDFEVKKEVNNILDRDILIVDDFLKKKKNGKKAEKLLSYDITFLNDLLSQRVKGSKITILTSNEPIEEVMLSIDDDKERVSSRLGNYEVLRFLEGRKYKDYRMKEKEITADNFDFEKLKGDDFSGI